MARHIMAVCVVCLLCADHVPCKDHFPINDLQLNAKVFPANSNEEYTQIIPDTGSGGYYDQYTDNSLTPAYYQKSKSRRKAKRHADHKHEHNDHQQLENHYHQPELTKNILQKLFTEYGQEDGETMNLSGLEKMLKKLGLYKLIETKEANTDGSSSSSSDDMCASNAEIIQRIQPYKSLKADDHQHGDENSSEHSEKCSNNSFSSKTNSSSTKTTATNNSCDDNINKVKPNNNFTLSSSDMISLCPIFLYQLIAPTSLQNSGCINQSLLSEMDLLESQTDHSLLSFNSGVEERDMFYVWLYAILSVSACSVLGLLGVSILPCMDSKFYKEIIQFFVALAVGTMCGDALLHLLPHAIANQSENDVIFKGLTAMGGIIFFYATEHGLTMISEWRKGNKRKEKQQNHARVLRDPESSINNSVAGDKLCKSKYSSYPYCYDEIAMDTKNDVHHPNQNSNHKNCNDRKLPNGNSTCVGNDINETAQSLLSQSYTPMSEVERNIPDSNTVSTNLDGSSNIISPTLAGTSSIEGVDGKNQNYHPEQYQQVTVILREHESSHHGHSHKHGHVHSPPGSLSAVAWMIILGDGLHNFTDGMAIGAAFAENLAGGFSTSLAVFCHELPHELGDFAILIKAGMSIRSAIYYNLLSSVLSFIGLFVGIAFGQSQNAAQWMFAAAAGLFIYIAMVDMMPELSSAHKNLQQCCLQILGMLTGILIMLFIALYEHDLMTIFSHRNPSTIPNIGN